MASKYESFCNNTTDLSAIYSGIDSMDRKAVLPPNWVASGTSNLYYLHGSGSSGNTLFKDGKDLGSEQGSEPSSDNTWRFVEADDRLEFFLASSSASALNSAVFEMGQDWDGLKTTICKEQADRMRSYLSNRPIMKSSTSTYQGASERDYDWIVIRCNAALAVADLIRSTDPEQAEEIESRIINDDGSGLLDRLKRGEYSLWNETTWSKEKGVVTVVSQNASSTGYIEDIKIDNRPTTFYDDVRVVIQNGGTFAVGTANSTVTYDVYVGNDDGLKQDKVVDAEAINGSYQALAYGASLRFAPGVYTTNDEFSVLFQSDETPVGMIKTGQIYR